MSSSSELAFSARDFHLPIFNAYLCVGDFVSPGKALGVVTGRHVTRNFCKVGRGG